MAKSKIQFQKGYSLFEFLKDYGTEAQCENALFTWRFPNGFVCPECANKTCCRLRRRPRVWQCNHCRHQMSLTGNTIFANTKLPLTKWFLAMHLLSQTKTGLSAMELKRQLGVKYDTAWMLKRPMTSSPSAASFSSMMSTGVASAVVANGVGARQARRRLWQQWP